MTTENQAALDHAWRHFALHADQRISVFNFYVASSSLLLSGLVYILASDRGPWPLGVATGVGAAGLSIIFWKLDQRSTELVKTVETVIEAIENSSFQPGSRVFSAIAALPVNDWPPKLRGSWSFGRSFRALFTTVALLGLVGATASAWRWERSGRPSSHKVETTAASRSAAVIHEGAASDR